MSTNQKIHKDPDPYKIGIVFFGLAMIIIATIVAIQFASYIGF